MFKSITLSLLSTLLYLTPVTPSQAGHCSRGLNRDRIKCLNSEVAFLTELQKKTRIEVDNLRSEIPKIISAAFPVGTIIAWNSKDESAPKGWKFCDGQEGRPDLNGRWLVGTNDSNMVGEKNNPPELAISGSFATAGEASGNYYGWGDTESDAPHATGRDHQHTGTFSGTIDQSKISPPSVQVRYIVKIE